LPATAWAGCPRATRMPRVRWLRWRTAPARPGSGTRMRIRWWSARPADRSEALRETPPRQTRAGSHDGNATRKTPVVSCSWSCHSPVACRDDLFDRARGAGRRAAAPVQREVHALELVAQFIAMVRVAKQPDDRAGKLFGRAVALHQLGHEHLAGEHVGQRV